MANARIRYLGFYDPLAEGKFLFEILGQLRHHGKGRLVTKTEWNKRWPDKVSYVKVLQARPKMDRWLRHGDMVGEWVLRGHRLGVYRFEKDLDRADWQLVHKHNEPALLEATSDQPLVMPRPAKIPVPPLFKHLMQKSGQRVLSELPCRVRFDVDHKMYSPKLDKELWNGKVQKSIYDVDPEIYRQLYGKCMPERLSAYGDLNLA